MRLKLEKIVKGGDCIAHLEGDVYFVHYGLPGETVMARITQIKKNIILADVAEVIIPSPHRIKPKCPFFGPSACGGCDFQHADLNHQRELKKDIVRQCLNFIGKLDAEFEVSPLSPAESGERWRNRIRLAADESGAAGMRRRHSHQIVPIKDCLISQVNLADLAVLEKRWPAGSEIELIFSDSDGKGPPDVSCRVLTKERFSENRKKKSSGKTFEGQNGSLSDGAAPEKDNLFFKVKGTDYRVSPLSFFQMHKNAAEFLSDTVLEYLSPKPKENAVDLYSGVGLFTLPLAKAVGEEGSVTGIESNVYAVKDAEYNLRHFPQARVLHASVTAYSLKGMNPDCVVLDPPRSGIQKEALEILLTKNKLKKIVYVSCDPATFARDAKIITSAAWDMKKFTSADLFPMTAHTETVALFERK